jgi:hypothetical protein
MPTNNAIQVLVRQKRHAGDPALSITSEEGHTHQAYVPLAVDVVQRALVPGRSQAGSPGVSGCSAEDSAS